MEQPSASPSFRRIGVLHHPRIEATHPVAREIQSWLAERNIAPWLALTWDEEEVRPEMPDLDMVIVLGGDGSMLRAARMAAPHGVPIFGINMGRLGFLTEASPENWRERLARVLEGEYWIEQRLMLEARAYRGDELLGAFRALNDVVISRDSMARVVELRTEIDGVELTTYVADGLIISTPTGSTAYALAVGGPILPPDLRNILVIPIAPHLTLDRAIVLSEGAHVRVDVRTDHQSILTVDGQVAQVLQHGDRIEAGAGDDVSRFIRLGERSYFYNALLDRLVPKYLSNE